jgi:hypothetical protein
MVVRGATLLLCGSQLAQVVLGQHAGGTIREPGSYVCCLQCWHCLGLESSRMVDIGKTDSAKSMVWN